MKQHYLPECYLKEFININCKINTIDINRLKYSKAVFNEPKFPSEVCYLKDFYTIKPDFKIRNRKFIELKSLHLETRFHEYENKYAEILKQIKERQAQLSVSDANLLIYALIEMKVRNPYFRRKAIDEKKEPLLNSELEKVRKKIDKADISNISNAEINEIINKKRLEIMSDQDYEQRAHISFLIPNQNEINICEVIAKKLMGFQWKILMSDNLFITTDNPGFSLGNDNRIQNTRFNKDFIFIVPLTPSLCLSVCDAVPDNKFIANKHEKYIMYENITTDLINIINQASLWHLSRYIFSNSKCVIDGIALNINNKHGL